MASHDFLWLHCSKLLESMFSWPETFLRLRNSRIRWWFGGNCLVIRRGRKDLLHIFTIFRRCAVKPPSLNQSRERRKSQRYPLKRRGEAERTSKTGPQEHPDLLDELQQRDRCIAELRGPTKETKWGLHQIHRGDSPDSGRARLPVIFCTIERTE